MLHWQIVQILSQVIGKTITHVNLTEQEFVIRLTTAGLSEDHTTALASLEGVVKQGGDEKFNDVVLKITRGLFVNMPKPASRSGFHRIA